MVSIDAIALNDDYKNLTVFEVSDVNAPDAPRMNWTYNFETKEWTNPTPVVPVVESENSVPIPATPTEDATEPLVGGQNG